MSVYKGNHEVGGITQLSLDTKPICNLRCTWCYNKHLNRDGVSKGSLSFKEKKELLHQAREIGAKALIIPGAGEPTLDPDFYRLIKSGHKQGLTTVVYTNLNGNIDEDEIKKLYDLDVSIGVKLDTFDKRYFQKHMCQNKKGDFEKFRRNLDSLLEVYRGSMVSEKRSWQQYSIHRVIANMVLTHENKEELERIAGYCKQNDLPLFVRPVKPVKWAEANLSAWKVLGNPSGEFNPSYELVNLSNHYNTLFSPSCTPEGHCAIYSFGLTVKDDGDILACPDHHDSKGRFGNVRDKPLKRIVQELNKQRNIKPGFCVMLPKVKHSKKGNNEN